MEGSERSTARDGVVVLTLVLALAVGIARGADNSSEGRPASHTIVMIDGGLLYPSALTMRQGDVLEFENYSSAPIRLVFIEPTEPADKLRCRLIDDRARKATWPLFDSGPSHDLTATVPPGRFASACSLAPGRYAYVMKPVGRDPRAPVETLGQKATITVE